MRVFRLLCLKGAKVANKMVVALRARRAVTVRPFWVRNDVAFAVSAAKRVHLEFSAFGHKGRVDPGLSGHLRWHTGRVRVVNEQISMLLKQVSH